MIARQFCPHCGSEKEIEINLAGVKRSKDKKINCEECGGLFKRRVELKPVVLTAKIILTEEDFEVKGE